MSALTKPVTDPSLPYLEYHPQQGMPAQRIVLDSLPFRIGRSNAVHWTIYSARISKEHAEIDRVGEDFHVRDLGSTNGTFVNGQRIEDAVVIDGDILHFAHEEFRFGCEAATKMETGFTTPCLTEQVTSALPVSLIRSSQHLHELITRNAVLAVFQPIVDLATRKTMGYEALGRGNHKELSANPKELLDLARRCRVEQDLSRAFRLVAVRHAVRLPANGRLFLNLHPSEMGDPDLFEHLRKTRANLPACLQMVMEVHESAVTDSRSLLQLREQFKQLNILLAFDDFGVGQTRLMELAEMPPDFIKLDMSLIRGIDVAEQRKDMVEILCRLIKERGVRVIAEGIETLEEARVCQSIGCQFGQGYLFGRPEPPPLFGE
jgi:EAL domain-containing protein (putative c-di-GMP-specific phosphodiesterase class I)